MVVTGYEHFGLLVGSPDEADEIRRPARGRDIASVNLESMSSSDDGFRSFRFRYLLPLAVEVQHLPQR